MITPPRFARNAICLEHGLCCFDAGSRAATPITADPTDRHSECAIGPGAAKPPGQLMLPRIAAPRPSILEGTMQVVRKRRDHGFQRRALAGRDHNIGLHSRPQLAAVTI